MKKSFFVSLLYIVRTSMIASLAPVTLMHSNAQAANVASAYVYAGPTASTPQFSADILTVPYTSSGTWGNSSSSVSAEATKEPLPSISLSATSKVVASNYQMDAVWANFIYYFSISGPNESSLVPVLISGQYKVETSNLGVSDVKGSASSVHALVGYAGTSSLYYFEKYCYTDCTSDSGTFSGSMNVLVSQEVRVEMSVLLDLYSNSQYGNSKASGYIDPYFEIDPTWALANPGFSILVSDGIGNNEPAISTVSEPETYVLMLTSLGLIGAINRRRKQKTNAT